MKADIKKDWVEALRSGEYLQGKSELKGQGRHCCLGVLCEALPAPTRKELAIFISKNSISIGKGIEFSSAVLNTEVCQAVGLSSKAHEELWQRNDQGESFASIADWIEENL